MHVARSSADEPVAEVAAALAPYAWREFTERMLARRVVGAVDRHRVIAFLTGLPGTALGAVEPVEPAEAADERVDVLVRMLDGQLWRGWSLARLCTDLSSALEAWEATRDSFDSNVRRLLEGH
jgi:hypothetical protein